MSVATCLKNEIFEYLKNLNKLKIYVKYDDMRFILT